MTDHVALLDIAEEVKAEFPTFRVSVPAGFVGVVGEVTTPSGVTVHIFHSIHNRADWEQAREDMLRVIARATPTNTETDTENAVLTEVNLSDII